MPRLSVAINSRRIRAGQRPGKVESQRNRKKNKRCQISFCRIVQLGTTDPLKSVFALPSIICWKEHRLAGTCHCLYSTETWIKSVSLLICMPSQQCTHCKYLSKKKKKTKKNSCILPWREETIFAHLPNFVTLPVRFLLKVTFICQWKQKQQQQNPLVRYNLNYIFWGLWRLELPLSIPYITTQERKVNSNTRKILFCIGLWRMVCHFFP